jgi:hypothetical protein
MPVELVLKGFAKFLEDYWAASRLDAVDKGKAGRIESAKGNKKDPLNPLLWKKAEVARKINFWKRRLESISTNLDSDRDPKKSLIENHLRDWETKKEQNGQEIEQILTAEVGHRFFLSFSFPMLHVKYNNNISYSFRFKLCIVNEVHSYVSTTLIDQIKHELKEPCAVHPDLVPYFADFSGIEVELTNHKKPTYVEPTKTKNRYELFRQKEWLKRYEKERDAYNKKYYPAKKSVIHEVQNSTFWLHNDNVYRIPSKDRPESLTDEEQRLLIKEFYFKQEKKFQKLKRQIELFEKLESSPVQNREPIPEEVRFAVWRRDEGKCVSCGSRDKIEFDHIIPLSQGGSNSARNLQILCEKCNREKSNII